MGLTKTYLTQFVFGNKGNTIYVRCKIRIHKTSSLVETRVWWKQSTLPNQAAQKEIFVARSLELDSASSNEVHLSKKSKMIQIKILGNDSLLHRLCVEAFGRVFDLKDGKLGCEF